MDWMIVICGAILWLEFLIRLLACNGEKDIVRFAGSPLLLPMPSAKVGLLVRALMLAVGSYSIIRFL